jgi:hypothetical protein
MNTMRMHLRPLLSGMALLICISFSGLPASSQAEAAVTTGEVDVRILNAIHEPEESAVSYVTVSVTARSTDKSFVIPNCAESTGKNVFCMALLQRPNGKIVPARKGLAATLGFEAPEYWKATVVPANSETSFEFSIDMGLLDVRPGEKVRLAFWIWPDRTSMKDEKRGEMVLTPVFRIPVKPD